MKTDHISQNFIRAASLVVAIGIVPASAFAQEAAVQASVPVVRDMYDIKPRALPATDPAAMPVVVSAGTRSQTLAESVEPGEKPFDGCHGSSRAVCAGDAVYRIFNVDISGVADGEPVSVATSGLVAWPGHAVPDTMLVMLKCADAGCSRGTVVAIDDNGNADTPETGDSMFRFVAQSGALYRLILTTRRQGAEGTADLTVSIGDQEPVRFAAVDFGGWHVPEREVRGGDTLFVGKNSNSAGAGVPGHREYHDSRLLFLTTVADDCDAECGEFFFNDDFAYGDSPMRLSRIDIPDDVGSVNGRVIVGVHDDVDADGAPLFMNARLFHHRRNAAAGGAWADPETIDRDGDGLTKEIEVVVGSCDSSEDRPSGGVGIMGMSCADYAARVKDFGGKWTSADSDNDGIPDGAEVFAFGVHCSSVPVLPYNNPGKCQPFGFRDQPGCPDGRYCVGLDMSAMSDPNPSVYDVYILNDYIKSGSKEYKVTAVGQELLKKTWHDAAMLCWDGSPPPCEGKNDLPYMFNVHAYSDGGPGLPVTMHEFADANFGSEVGGGVRWTLAYYNRFFRPEFRYTGVGFYALSTAGPEGQSKRSYRSLAWRGAREGEDRSHSDVLAILSHESGHILGLTDLDYTKYGYPCGDPAACRVVCPEVRLDPQHDRSQAAWPQYPNVPSLMNYGYNSFGAGMRDLSAGPPTSGSRYHEGCSRNNLRFSKGLLGTLSESDLVERNPLSRADVATWQDRMLVREVECFTDKGRNKAPATDPFKGRCDEKTCRVNWDAWRFDGESPEDLSTPYKFDLSMGNLGGAPTDVADCANDLIGDRNELATMQAIGKDSRGRMFQPEFDIFKATFNAGVLENLAGWDIPTVESGVTWQTPADVQGFKKSARFGESGTSFIRLSSTGPESPLVAIADSDKLMIRFDFLAEIADGAGAIQFLVGHEDVRIYLERGVDAESLTLTGFVGSSPVRAKVKAGRWNRVFLHTDVIDGRNVIKLAVAPFNSEAGRFAAAGDSCPDCAVVCSTNTWTGDFDANADIWIGSHVGGMYPFTGLIDNINIGNFVFRPAVPKCR